MKQKGKKKGTKILTLISVILVVALAAGMLVGNFLYNFALNANRKNDVGREVAEANEGTAQPSLEGLFADSGWLDERSARNEFITSDDGLKLHALMIEDFKDAPWVVLVHGYTSNAESMATFAKHYYELGFNILMPDLRGHGESEGDYRGMGWDDRLDVIKWLSVILERDPDCDIALHGISMGGATVMMVSGEPLPENVKAIVEDCGYSSIYDEFSCQLKNMFRLPAFPFMEFASLVTRIRAGYSLKDGSSVEQVKKSVTPTLFIHGSMDTFVPFWMLDVVYEAASCEKQKLVVEGAGHGASLGTDPELYWGTVDGFLEGFIG